MTLLYHVFGIALSQKETEPRQRRTDAWGRPCRPVFAGASARLAASAD